VNKKIKRNLVKTVKKANKSILICFVLFFIIGLGSGFVSAKALTKNDTFKVNGEQTIELNINDEYTDQGAIAIEFNKNISSEIIVEGLDKVDTSKEGKYIITYTLNSKRYKNIKRIRYVIVKESGDSND
jgi:hypothetical protein